MAIFHDEGYKERDVDVEIQINKIIDKEPVQGLPESVLC